MTEDTRTTPSGHTGRVAVITGGASGIGRATAALLAEAGASVIIADINAEAAEATARTLPGASGQRLDVASEADWQTLLDGVIADHGQLDYLVNCAGIGTAGPFEDLSLNDWNAMLSVNLTGVFLGCREAVKRMNRQRGGWGGAIVNVSSIGGLVGGEDIAGYCASKGGVTILTKSVALYCGRQNTGIRCNSIHPTYVDSEMLDPVAEQFPSREAMLAGMAAQVPLGRVARPVDIAHAIAFLLSGQAAMITGHGLLVDGGQLAGLPAAHTQ
ncbi:SDR family NAD(P)-dependent oxidoreductase [Yunchengibacter salinarum]|uniref:SDR family NAD(P)-dependent oxidoreductase n=1 Tax=Yunchengibacter salinarum TaxID=3133399 RepID=UPI0035B64A14